MSFRKIGTQPNRFAKFSQHFMAVRTLAAEQKPEQVVRIRPGRIFGEHHAKASDSSIPIRSGLRRRSGIEPSFELSHRLVEVASTKIDDSEIDIGCG